MSRRPPGARRFPWTSLFRAVPDRALARRRRLLHRRAAADAAAHPVPGSRGGGAPAQGEDGAGGGREGAARGARGERRGRSEEHTSEPQSQPELVCRLLLEKKKNTDGNAVIRVYSAESVETFFAIGMGSHPQLSY